MRKYLLTAVILCLMAFQNCSKVDFAETSLPSLDNNVNPQGPDDGTPGGTNPNDGSTPNTLLTHSMTVSPFNPQELPLEYILLIDDSASNRSNTQTVLNGIKNLITESISFENLEITVYMVGNSIVSSRQEVNTPNSNTKITKTIFNVASPFKKIIFKNEIQSGKNPEAVLSQLYTDISTDECNSDKQSGRDTSDEIGSQSSSQSE